MAVDNGDTLSPISQWAYPFPRTGATGTVDPDAYLAAFQASDGPFPMGLNGLWHGGIHLDQAGASPSAADSAMDRNGGVRCIADGVVVAYRLDSDYQHLTYLDNSTALYSRSFTLVKHKLTLPALPPNAPPQPNNAPHSPTAAPANSDPNKLSAEPADSLVFFSLYMHLAPCTVYKHSEQDKDKKTWPSYYNAEPLYTVSDSRATDKQDNVETGEAIKGSHVHRDNRNHAGESIGILPAGSKVKIQRSAHAPKNWGRIQSILSGDIVPLEPGKPVPRDALSGWVYLPWLDSEINPAALDSVYVLPKPIRIGAGEVVGYLGEYQNAEHASTLPPSPQRALLHVEVFAGDDLPAFLARSRARAEQLTQEPKTQLVLSKGAHLYGYNTDGDLTLPANTTVKVANDAPQTGMWTKVQVKAAGSTNATHYWILRKDLTSKNARPAWNSFPLSLSAAPTGTSDYARVVNIAGLTGHVDDQKHTWYEVDAGDASMNTVKGFVCASGQPNVSLHNKWAWAGFELLSSSLTTADLYKRYLYLKGDSVTEDEKAAFEASFNTAKGDALIAKLDEIVTPKDQRQARVCGQDLLAALSPSWRASRVDHLVVKYESEWGGPMSKWDALDPFMHDGLPYWKAEKERIKVLQMWDSCAAALQPVSTPTVYHIHPVGLIGNFSVSADLITLEMLHAVDPAGSVDYHRQILPYLNKYAKGYGITTPQRIAHFLAQVATESQFKNIEENLNYSEKRMKEVYGCKLPPHGNRTPKLSMVNGDVVCNFGQLRPELWTSPERYAHNPENLANLVYKNKYHNGPEESGDGYKYRGRGLIQTTFKANYEVFNTEHNHRFPNDQKDFVENPDLLLSNLEYGVESAFVYWTVNRNVNSVADTGDVAAVTQQINGGQHGHPERLLAYNKVAPLLGLPQQSN